MTRLWIGVGLLLLLLAGGIALWLGTVPFHEALARDLDRAAALAVCGDWEQAQSLALAARDRWRCRQDGFAAVTDHAPMEQMHALFRELSLLGPEQSVDFACVCIQLSQTARAVGETQALHWWSVL